MLTGPEFVSWLVEELKEKNSESDEVLKSILFEKTLNIPVIV